MSTNISSCLDCQKLTAGDCGKHGQSYFYPAPIWTLQRCPVCNAKGYVWSGLPTLTPDRCSFCDGKMAVLVSSLGSVRRVGAMY
jgi:hypothetical protein